MQLVLDERVFGPQVSELRCEGEEEGGEEGVLNWSEGIRREKEGVGRSVSGGLLDR